MNFGSYTNLTSLFTSIGNKLRKKVSFELVTQAEYNALVQAGTVDPNVDYHIYDTDLTCAPIDDTTTASDKVWSSSKINTELAGKADASTYVIYDNLDATNISSVRTRNWRDTNLNHDFCSVDLIYKNNDLLRFQFGTDGYWNIYKYTASTETWSKLHGGSDYSLTTELTNSHKATVLTVSTSGWVTDTTSQSGTTLYKKEISLSHVYVPCPEVAIGASGTTLPTKAQQTAYDLVQYATVDSSTNKLYLYASAVPSTQFYIKVTGVD